MKSATNKQTVDDILIPSPGTTKRGSPWPRYLLNRLSGVVVLGAFLVVLTFLIVHLVPGDPARNVLGINASAAQVADVRKQLGLTQPLYTQFGQYAAHVFTGDLGTSYVTSQSVDKMIGQRLPVTAELAGLAVVFVLVIGFPLGVLIGSLQHRRRGRWTGPTFTMLASLGGAAPEYITGTVLIFVVALSLGLLPVQGGTSPQHIILPVIAIGFGPTLVFARIVRNETATVLTQEYIMTARSKRLPTWRLYGGHVLAVLGPIIWGSQANQLGTGLHSGASGAHPLGTDALGRDVLARTLAATRLTIWMALLATLIAVGIGIVLGAAIVLAGRRVRTLGERLIDLLVAYPPIIVALAVTAIFRPSETSVVVAIGLAFTPQFARLTNTLADSVRERDFVSVAQFLGLRRSRVLRRHILPNIAGPLLVLTSVGFASAIITLSGLSFIGLGVQQPQYDWGALLSAGLQDLNTNPVEVIGPAAGILLTGLAAGLVGDGLNQHLDPRLRVGLRRRRRGHREETAVWPPTASHVVALPTEYEDKAATADRSTPVAEGSEAMAERMPVDAVVSVRDLWVASAERMEAPIVRGVSLDIHRGEILGLVGESGSGKTLTAMSIALLLPSGLEWAASTLEVNGREVGHKQGPPPKHLATEMGIVFQDPSSSFNPARHIGPQITEVARVHSGLSRKESYAQAVERLRESQVSSPKLRMHQYPHELSGGMRQRAMIAMALMTSPAVLIADEPTTSLDVTVQADVLRLLRRLNTAHGMAILLISHDITVVSSLCDRVCVMYAGEIVEELSTEDIRAQQVCHPYTRALLAASPRLDPAVAHMTLTPLPGRPPRPGAPISGCAFAPRCPLVVDICHTVNPELRDLGDGRRAACHVTTGPLEEVTPRV